MTENWDYGRKSKVQSQYKYYLLVKNREFLKGVGVNFSLIIINWEHYATNNNKQSTS